MPDLITNAKDERLFRPSNRLTKVLQDSLRAALKREKQQREDVEWLKDTPEVLAIHVYDDGFAIDLGHGTSAEVAHTTLHAAVEAARKAMKA